MKKYLSLLLAICFMLPSVSSYAQALEDGEAFYIYRNDGDFNGFFFDEVLEMRYSEYDLDMVEFDDYVVQEIVTADSVYRIPLCVIDSISFVQPPIEFNPNLKYISKEVYGEYFARYDQYRYIVEFDKSIPDDLLPNVGDVIIGFCSELWYHPYFESFGIKVKSRTYNSRSGRWELAGSRIDKLSDVFTKFVSTERLLYTPDGKSVRRMAGLKTLATRSDASGSLDLINLQGTLTREFEEGKNGTLAITLDYGIRAGISVTYDIDIDHIFVRMATEQELSAQAGVSGSLSATWEPPIDIVPSWLTAIRFPACLPIFETQPVPSLFFKAEGKLTLKSTLPKVCFKSKQLVIISDRTGNWLNCKCSSNLTSGYGDGDENLFQPGDSRLTLEGSIYSGVKFEARIKTNSWAEKLFQSSIGVDVSIGPKLSGYLDISLPELAKGDVYYRTLKSAYINFAKCSIDMEASAKVNMYGYPDQEAKFGDMSIGLGTTQLYAVADVQYTKNPVVNYQNNTITANLKWKNDVFLGHQVGFAVFKKHNLEYGRHDDDECVYDDSWHHFRKENEKEFVTHQLEAGTYWYAPYVTFLGEKVFFDIQETNFGPIVKLDVDSVSVAGSGKDGFVRAVIHYECKDDIEISAGVTFKNTRSLDRENISIDYNAKTITLNIPDNKNFYNLTGTISINAKLKDPSARSTRISLPIRQAANTNIKEINIYGMIWGKVQRIRSQFFSTNGEVDKDEKQEDTTERVFGAYKDYIPCTTSFRNNQLTITAQAETENEAVEVRLVFNVFDNEAELEYFSSNYAGTEVSGSSTITTTESIAAVNVDHHPEHRYWLYTDREELPVYIEKSNCSVAYRQVDEGSYTYNDEINYHKHVTEMNGLLEDPDRPLRQCDFKYRY